MPYLNAFINLETHGSEVLGLILNPRVSKEQKDLIVGKKCNVLHSTFIVYNATRILTATESGGMRKKRWKKQHIKEQKGS